MGRPAHQAGARSLGASGSPTGGVCGPRVAGVQSNRPCRCCVVWNKCSLYRNAQHSNVQLPLAPHCHTIQQCQRAPEFAVVFCRNWRSSRLRRRRQPKQRQPASPRCGSGWMRAAPARKPSCRTRCSCTRWGVRFAWWAWRWPAYAIEGPGGRSGSRPRLRNVASARTMADFQLSLGFTVVHRCRRRHRARCWVAWHPAARRCQPAACSPRPSGGERR